MLYRRLFRDYAIKGKPVLDTHLGSQNSRIEAYALGFDFKGYETNLRYFTEGNVSFETFKKDLDIRDRAFTVEYKQEGLFSI